MIARLFWLLAWVVAFPWSLVLRLRARVPRGTYLLIEVDGPVLEAPRPRPAWSLLRERKHATSLLRVARLVDEAAKDARVEGLLFVLKGLRGGFATATALRRAIVRARSAGKRVVVYLPQVGGTKEAYVAAAADRVVLGPPAVLAPVGLLSSTRYVRGALDRAGVVPEVYARGRFKTAAERIERSTMSDAQREQMQAVLDGLYAEITGALAEGRRVGPDAARAMIDGAPYVGEQAVTAGLADAVAYEDELPKTLAAGGEEHAIREAEGYLRRRTALRPRALRSSGVIAVLHVHGAIAGGPGLPMSRLALDANVMAAVRIALENPAVRGAILHVDSPGGSALASARIHHELVRLAAAKPLIACMGDVAASGGYYVAAAAHEIVAHPTTITGSIGVIAARVALAPLLERLGVTTEVLKRGAHAGLLDRMAPLSDEDRRALERSIDHSYDTFLRVVAAGRRRSLEEIEAVAQGRVWLGTDAVRAGLVDRLGGFDDALDAVRQRIGRGADRLRVVALRGHSRRRQSLDASPGAWAETARSLLARFPEQALLLEVLGVDPSAVALLRDPVLAWCQAAATLRG